MTAETEHCDVATIAYMCGARDSGRRIRLLERALRDIYAARLRDGVDHGYGWDIGLLNSAMDAALPLLGEKRPPRMSREERETLRNKLRDLLDREATDHAR